MWATNPGALDTLLDALVAHRDRSAKPFVAILQPQHVEDVAIMARKKTQERGIAVFASFERAARALRRAITYWRFKSGMD
jgi:acyl-CoA synthetase (NDP forming)